jgi:hypothetical protein
VKDAMRLKAVAVNCDPQSVLEISGLPCWRVMTFPCSRYGILCAGSGFVVRGRRYSASIPIRRISVFTWRRPILLPSAAKRPFNFRAPAKGYSRCSRSSRSRGRPPVDVKGAAASEVEDRIRYRKEHPEPQLGRFQARIFLVTAAIRGFVRADAGSSAGAVLVPNLVLILAADEGLIDFDNSAKLFDVSRHGDPDLAAHSPGGPVGTEAHNEHDLVRIHSLFAGEHEVDDAVPIPQRHIGVLEGRPD